MGLWRTPDELAVDQRGRLLHMNLAPQGVHVVGPERNRLSPTKATVGAELDQLCTAGHPLLHRIGQLGHLLGGQIALIPFAGLRYICRLCRIPPDEAVVLSMLPPGFNPGAFNHHDAEAALRAPCPLDGW